MTTDDQTQALLPHKPVEETQRVARVGQHHERYIQECQQQKKKPEAFCDNEIKTSKYTLVPFSRDFILWKNLYEQFQRLANVYFVFIAILQVIPGVSPTGRFTTIAPLALVMFLSLLKDAYEDLKRHRQDHELNRSSCRVFRNGAWTHIEWRDVVVGDIMKIRKGEAFPADLFIVHSTEPEGICYIETASLDGETNLKIRKSCALTYKLFDPERPGDLSLTLSYELPNNRLYNFDGKLNTDEEAFPVNNDNVFLRGSQLRNTAVAVGIVLFTGRDTKLMKNSSEKRHKMSNIDVITNRQIGYIFLLQLVLCVICAIGLGIFTTELNEHWYLADNDSNAGTTALVGFLTFLILFNNLIPISLYVSMEMVKLVQAALINNDVEMYHPETDTPALSRTSALNEELGQVSYVLSDKTGTLTCNMMDFTKFSCIDKSGDAVCYGTGITEIARAAASRTGKVLVDDKPADYSGKDGFNFYDERISNGKWASQPNVASIEDFFRHLAVCHTVVAEYEDKNTEAVYQAASPDEGCLVKGAREFGVIFDSRTENSATITIHGRQETYTILNIIEFDSTRKRMSVIARDPTGKLLLLCKGADSVIYERLKKTAENAKLLNETLEMLTTFAAEGLRTLVIAKAELNEDEYRDWAKRYQEAQCALVDRANKVAAVGEEIEKDLELVGTTAIEDKLQHKVPQTIELLMAAGVKVWVLTGDKQETAINIGYACALLNNDMTMWEFDGITKDTVLQKLEEFLSDAKENAADASPSDMSLVIQGGLLETVLEDRRTSLVFLELATMCKSVICCRVSPLQKAQVVTLVRENIRGSITLAVGDGANDVSMIQAASVGVGISGLEGLQAARASDYSIAQFRFLQRLLLVHGRWNYRRIARLIQYSFYKNITLFTTQFWFCIFNAFSGQTLYDQWALAVYNVWFTAFPIMALAVFDRDVEAKRLLSMDQFPDLYIDGLTNRLFNTKNFWVYVANALFQSWMCFFIPMWCFGLSTDGDSGFDFGISALGILCYTVVVFVVSSKVALETLSWTWINVTIIVVSVGVWFAFIFSYSLLYQAIKIGDFASWYEVPYRIAPSGAFWLIIILVPFMTLLRDFCWKTFRRNVHPELSHVIQTLEGEKKDFCRADVEKTHPHLLNRLTTTAPKKGAYLAHQASMSMRTGYAFSQEEGQAEITAIIGRAFGRLRGKSTAQSPPKRL
jgi:phospholipid-translocating P-type ATPase (flippase)